MPKLTKTQEMLLNNLSSKFYKFNVSGFARKYSIPIPTVYTSYRALLLAGDIRLTLELKERKLIEVLSWREQGENTTRVSKK